MSHTAISYQVLMEHQTLAHFTSALRGTLGWNHPGPDLSRRVQSLRFSAQAFQRHLKHLMTLEDEDYRLVISESAPHLSRDIDELQQEHERIRKRLGRILTRLKRLQPSDGEKFAKISDDLTVLLEELDQHNEKELALLQKALLPEEGGKDEYARDC